MAPLETAIRELRQILATDSHRARVALERPAPALRGQGRARPATGRGIARPGSPRAPSCPTATAASSRRRVVAGVGRRARQAGDGDDRARGDAAARATSSTTCSGCTTWSTTRSRSSSAARSSPSPVRTAADRSVRSAEGAGFEPAADITASDRFQGGSDRPLRHPSRSPTPEDGPGPVPECSARREPDRARCARHVRSRCRRECRVSAGAAADRARAGRPRSERRADRPGR